MAVNVYVFIIVAVYVVLFVPALILFVQKMINRKRDPLLGDYGGDVSYVQLSSCERMLCIGVAFQACMKGDLLETKWFVTWFILYTVLTVAACAGFAVYFSMLGQ